MKREAINALLGHSKLNREAKDMNAFTQTMKTEFLVQKFGLKHDQPEEFALCQWQTGRRANIRFLVYRTVMTFYFLITLTMCVGNLGRVEGQAVPVHKWLIFLTNWGYSVYTLQALLGTALLFRYLRDDGKYDPKSCECEMTWGDRLYWVLNTIAVVIGFSITGSYWVAIYNPARDILDMLSVIAHVLNSITMGIDFCLSRHPVRLLHFYWPVGFLTSYFTFTLVYFLLGGTDHQGRHKIYSILDWEQPLRTSIICANALLYVLCSHILVWGLYLLRRWIFQRFIQSKLPQQKETVFIDGYI